MSAALGAFSSAVQVFSLIIGITPPEVVPMPRVACAGPPGGGRAITWSYTTGPDQFKIGICSERFEEESFEPPEVTLLAAHEVCHIKMHPEYVDQPTKMKNQETYMQLEREASECAVVLNAMLFGMLNENPTSR